MPTTHCPSAAQHAARPGLSRSTYLSPLDATAAMRRPRARDSISTMSLPQIAEDSPTSTTMPSIGSLRCGSPASLSSLSSFGSSTFSSSLSSIDDLDETGSVRSTGSSRYRSGSRSSSKPKRRISFHPNVLLWSAAQQGDFTELLQILLNATSTTTTTSIDKSGDDRLAVNESNHQGITPLHLCCFAGADECARLLLLLGATADCSDDDGWSPLHAAAVGSHDTIVTYLVRAGADLHRQDIYGRTAADVATNKATKLLLRQLAMEPLRTVRNFTASGRMCTDV